MLYKNNKEFPIEQWKGMLPNGIKLPVTFKLDKSFEKELENGRKVKVYNQESFEKRAFVKIQDQEQDVISGVQYMKDDMPNYSGAIAEFVDGKFIAKTYEDAFIMFYHPAFNCDSDFKEYKGSSRRAAPKFSIYEPGKLFKKKTTEQKLVAALLNKMYNMDENTLRMMYIEEGYGEFEPTASIDEIQDYFHQRITSDYAVMEEKLSAKEVSPIAAEIYAAKKAGEIIYVKSTGAFKLKGSKEPFWIVAEGMREPEKAMIALVQHMEAKPDKTLVEELAKRMDAIVENEK